MTLQQDSTHPTGVATNDRGGSTAARARLRKAKAAIEMKRAGASWDDVAEVLGYPTARQALVATERALEDGAMTQESQDFMRKLAGQRLDRLLRAVWAKAIDPDHPEQMVAQREARANIDRAIRLFGLDAPQEVLVTSPAATEIERFVATVLQHQSPALEEADVFELDEADYEETPVPSVNPEGDDSAASV